MAILDDFVLQAGVIFFIFLSIYWLLSKKNLQSKLNPKLKRLIQYALFLVIFILIIFIFQKHSQNYINSSYS